MAELVALDSMFPPGPAAAANPSGEQVSPGTSPAVAPSAPAGPDVTARISELEGLVNRQRDQIAGSRQEFQRLSSEIQALRQAPPPVAQAPAPVAAAPAAVAPPRVPLQDALHRYVVDNDPSLIAAWEAQARQPSLTAEDVARVMQEHTNQLRQETQATQQAQTVNMSLQQALASRHPELANMQQHGAFATATATRYQQLLADPVTALTYTPNPAAMYKDPASGMEYDMRVLLNAADYVKAAQPTLTAPPPTSLGTMVPGATPPAAGPVIPRSLVEGPTSIFTDPEMQAVMRQIGWGDTTRDQVQTMLQHLPAQTRTRWSRGEA